MDIQFGIVPSEFDLVSTLKNTTHSSSKVMGNAVLLSSLVLPSYSIVRIKPRRDIRPSQRYVKVDLVIHALSMVEDIEFGKESLTKVVYSAESIVGRALSCLVIIVEFFGILLLMVII